MVLSADPERRALGLERRSVKLLLAGDARGGWEALQEAFAAYPRAASRYAEGQDLTPKPERRRDLAMLSRLDEALRRGRDCGLLCWRAAVKRRLMDYAGAAADLDAAAKLGRLSAAALTWRGEARLQSFSRDEGLADLAAALRLPDAASWNWAWRGRALINLEHELEESFRCLDRSISLDPGWGQALAWRGEARRRKGDVAGALRDFEAALKGDLSRDDRPLVRGWRALAILSRGDAARARSELRALVRLMPGYSAWLLGLSQAERALGNTAAWIENLDRAAKLSSKHSQEARGWDRERVEAALAELRKAGGGSAALRRWRGFLLLRAGRAQESLADLEAACARQPRRALGWLWRAEAFCALGRMEEAGRACARALKLEPRCVESLLLKARLAAAAGDKRAALSAYAAAQQADGRCTLVYAERGALLLALGDAAGACADLERAVWLDSRDPAPWVDLAQARALRGDRKGSADALRRASALDPARAAERAGKWRMLAEAARK